jgi:hypothetical protein
MSRIVPLQRGLEVFPYYTGFEFFPPFYRGMEFIWYRSEISSAIRRCGIYPFNTGLENFAFLYIFIISSIFMMCIRRKEFQRALWTCVRLKQFQKPLWTWIRTETIPEYIMICIRRKQYQTGNRSPDLFASYGGILFFRFIEAWNISVSQVSGFFWIFILVLGTARTARGVGIRVPLEWKYFSSPRRPDRFWGLLCVLFSGCRGVNRPGSEGGHSPTSAEVKKTWICTVIPPYLFMMFLYSLFGSHWSMEHPWNLPFHFSFLIQDSR